LFVHIPSGHFTPIAILVIKPAAIFVTLETEIIKTLALILLCVSGVASDSVRIRQKTQCYGRLLGSMLWGL